MDDLLTFLRARYDAEEQDARMAVAITTFGDRWIWDESAEDSTLQGLNGPIAEVHAAIGPHIARHDPARVLAEVEAMRKVLACWPDPTGAWTADQAHAARMMKEHILRLLAEPYREAHTDG